MTQTRNSKENYTQLLKIGLTEWGFRHFIVASCIFQSFNIFSFISLSFTVCIYFGLTVPAQSTQGISDAM